MKILVTGGAGYIGAYLVPHLLAAGHKIRVFDSMMFGNGHLPSNDNLEVIKGDLREIHAVIGVCKDQDAVIHLGAVSAESMCGKDELNAKLVNINGTMNVAVGARDCGINKFILASSVAVYGSTDHDAVETDELNPTTIYGQCKKEAEQAVLRVYPDAIIVRSASVCGYSPNMAFHLTINKMVNDAINTGKITVNGGTQKRCHIHMMDICKAYQLLLEMPDIKGEVFNLVHSNLTVRDTAEMVARVLGHTVVISTGPATDNRSYTVDGSKALRVLKFSPTHRLEDAIWHMKAVFDSHSWKDSMELPLYQRMYDVIG